MHINGVVLAAAAAVIGLVAGAVIAYGGPVLARTRVPDAPVAPPANLIPLVGPVLSRWRPRTTIALEVVTAGLLAGLSAHYGSSISLLLASAATLLLVLIATIDLEHRLVLNSLSLPGTAAVLAVSFLWPHLGLESAALGAAAGFLVFLVLQLLGRGALGAGDTKLALLIGAVAGMPGVFNALFFGVILGGLGALVYLIVLRRGRKEFMPYGPYLAAGAIIFLFTVPPT
jgi:prepilin signal peptidase PulO-like enzyme (type II secretory pathway)